MKDINTLVSDKKFLFKAVVALLCLISIILWSVATMKFADVGGYSKMGLYYNTMVAATGSYLVIMGVLLIIYIVDDSDRMYEILFLIGGIGLNIIAGIITFVVAIGYDGNWVSIVIGGLMIASGVVMIFDLIGTIKQ